eukprot:TRINITY_DN2187_c2_g2_i2.p1 TRINITY_DN2187_c2_g2~~TRINITY_DN2187_c2_g2_i2.p1  ORF type:complete len:478 (+),score=100.05 TRINITY_DN2187_c2_g2_i2:61-1494(+)
MPEKVTVFSIGGCPHCSKAKKHLEVCGIGYVEISLDDYPQCRKGMLEMAGKLSVPQIFVGNKHYGDAEKVVSLAKDDITKLVNNSEEVTDERLKFPDTPPVPPAVASNRKTESAVIGGKSLTYMEIAKNLENNLNRSEKSSGMTAYYNVCTSDSINHCMHTDKKDKVVDTLLELGIVKKVPKTTFFRLTSDSAPNVLNSYRKWTDRVDPPMTTLKCLKTMLNEIKGKYKDVQGKIDYLSMTADDKWPDFLEATCELQGVDVIKMPPDLRKAFVINCYNLFITVAFAVAGIPESSLKRLAFFDDVKMNLGGLLYSFNDLENGILRGNRKAPFHLSVPFAKGDARQAAVMPADKRVHFALNCGAASCPPVKQFTKDAISLELDIVSAAFCESDSNVLYNKSKNTLTVSQIFSWYSVDFGSSSELVSFLASATRGEKSAVLKTAASPSMKFFPYSWDTDASQAPVYKGSRSTEDRKKARL